VRVRVIRVMRVRVRSTPEISSPERCERALRNMESGVVLGR
jgi:hypothetical protein